MSLQKYKQKRSFDKTPEPKGKIKKSAGELLFVVQKHNATRLHYDFRLELDGTLKSWAVPKGPSMNPADKRLAMMVEDHPFEYRNFEGIIPEGNYGAGEVIIWDEGDYAPEPVGSRKENEKTLRRGLDDGKLLFTLHGHKLKGLFTIFKLKTEDNAWLLVKKKDEFATAEDITKQDRSVRTGMRVEDLAPHKHAAPKSPAAPKRKTKGKVFGVTAPKSSAPKRRK